MFPVHGPRHLLQQPENGHLVKFGDLKHQHLVTFDEVGLHLINTILRIVHYEILPLLLDINDYVICHNRRNNIAT